MSSRLRLLICAALLFALTDGHWAVIQSIAWARMIQQYSESTSLAEAVRDTFSGQKPCSMCEQIAQAKSNRPHPLPGAPDMTVRVKLDPFALTAKALCPLPCVDSESYPDYILTIPPSCMDGPPSPVPRLLWI